MNFRSTSATPSACQDSGGCEKDAVRVGWKAGSKVCKKSEGCVGFGGDCILTWTRKISGKWRGGVFGWYSFGVPAKAAPGKIPIPHTTECHLDSTLWRPKAYLHIGLGIVLANVDMTRRNNLQSSWFLSSYTGKNCTALHFSKWVISYVRVYSNEHSDPHVLAWISWDSLFKRFSIVFLKYI